MGFLSFPSPCYDNFNLTASLKGLPGASGSTICPLTPGVWDGRAGGWVGGEGGGLKVRLSGATSENYSPRNSLGGHVAETQPTKTKPCSEFSPCTDCERGLDIRMPGSSSVSPNGVGKTDPASVSQLAWCGAATASPSPAQTLSLSHSPLVCSSTGQARVHSLLVSLSECFSDCHTLLSTLKPPPEPLSMFPIQGSDSALSQSHHSSSCSSCL